MAFRLVNIEGRSALVLEDGYSDLETISKGASLHLPTRQ